MKVSTLVMTRIAFVSLGLLAAACDNGTPMFSEAVVGANPGANGDAPGQDAIADSGDPEEQYSSNPVDDTTPADRGEVDPGSPSTPALTSWTFNASTIASGSLNFMPSSKLASQTLMMDNNVVASEKTFTQVDRPMLTEVFSQGSELKKQSEIFKQSSGASGALDLLLVVDNSGSMTEEQQNLSGKLSPLLTYVKDSDWRIGVVTTDPNDGCLRALISKTDAKPEQAFATAVQAGIKGSGNERGILQAVNGLKGQCNPGGSWLRNQSTVGVLIVSDEDNCSAGKDCGSDPWASGSYLTDYLSSIRQPGINARVYGLIGHPSLSSSQCKTMAAKANIYAAVIDETGGSWGSICAADYSQTLQAISKDISVILLTQFTLQYKPVVDSVKVYLDGVLQKSGYVVHENVIEFANAPKAGANVSFEYEFSADAPKSEFALRDPAASGSAKVYLDGVETKAFTYDANANAVRFENAPKSKAIKIVYRRGDELPKAFQMDKGVGLANLKVTVSGQALAANAYSYSALTGVLTLNTAPQDKAVIVVSANKILEHALEYAIQIGESSMSAWDGSSGKAIAAKFGAGSVAFAEADYAPGRKVLIKGQSPATWIVPLDRAVFPDDLKVSSASGSCEAFKLENNKLDLSACGFRSNEEVKIAFNYEKERKEEFDLAMLESVSEAAKWTVKVNGVETKDYKIISGRLYMSSLPMQAIIEVTMQGAPIL